MDIVPFLLVERPGRGVVVRLLDAERYSRRLLEVVEMTVLPGDQEAEEREPREQEERVEHPVGHDPVRLLVLGLVMRERARGARQQDAGRPRERTPRPPHCWPSACGGTSFCSAGGSLSPRAR